MMDLDDKSLFLDAMADVKPLKTSLHYTPTTKKTTAALRVHDDEQENPLTKGFLDILPRQTPLAFQRDGVQQGVIDKLRAGKYPQQASLNLLRQPVEDCRQLLFRFVLEATRTGIRNLLIIHGKGREDKSHANIIRSYLARWLTELDDVQAFCCAAAQHGGSGACYVVLRKSPAAKLATWERHAKRSR